MPKRTDHRHFPAEFAAMVTRLQTEGGLRLGPINRSTARTARREWYRYLSYLRASYGTDPVAAGLYDIANSFSVFLPRVSPEDPDNVYFILRTTPLVALSRLEPTQCP